MNGHISPCGEPANCSCAEIWRDAFLETKESLSYALEKALTALGHLNDRESPIKGELRSEALAVGWKALGRDRATVPSSNPEDSKR